MKRSYRKRPYQAPRDRAHLSMSLRGLGEKLEAGKTTAVLVEAESLLADVSLKQHERARIVALVGDSAHKRAAFEQAMEIYQRAAAMLLSHQKWWLRPLIGQVKSLLGAVRVDEAKMVARHAHDVACRKRDIFEDQVRRANDTLREKGSVVTDSSPLRPSVVATRMGFLFLKEGELAAADEMFQLAVNEVPRGASRARHGLAEIALAQNDVARAAALAEEAIRFGRYSAKTLPAWVTLISARRGMAKWRIPQGLLAGLNEATPGVRARAVLVIVREMRKREMRQWEELALKWMGEEGGQFPIIETELKKMIVATWKTIPGHAEAKFLSADQLLRTKDLSRNEWLAAAKEKVRAGIWAGHGVDLESLIQHAETHYGGDSGPRTAHSLALSCMMAKRHDLARQLLERNISELSESTAIWRKSVWALARMENLIGRHAAAADLFRRFGGADAVPTVFRLKSFLLWLENAALTREGTDPVAVKRDIAQILARVEDPFVVMDFARQVRAGPAALRSWSGEIFARGEAEALRRYEAEADPAAAMDILFRITRRQVYDFRQYSKAVHLWEAMSPSRRNLLWSLRSTFWGYLGLLCVAYAKSATATAMEGFYAAWLNDSATPPEGWAQIGIPAGKWLMNRGRSAEAVSLYEKIVEKAPTHALAAAAWYWLALKAHNEGDIEDRNRCAQSLRRAQGLNIGLRSEWEMDARALLLIADLNVNRIDPQAVNYSKEFLLNQQKRMIADLEKLS